MNTFMRNFPNMVVEGGGGAPPPQAQKECLSDQHDLEGPPRRTDTGIEIAFMLEIVAGFFLVLRRSRRA